MSVGVMIIIVAGIIAIGVFQIINGMKPKREQNARKIVRYKRLHSKLSTFFITQTSLASIYNKLANLSIYSKEELQILSVQYLIKSWGGAFTLILFAFIFFKDFVSILICTMFGVLFSTVIVDKQIDKAYIKVLQALREFLSSLRQEYLRLGNVVESIKEAECNDLIKKPIDEIISILEATEPELKLQEFYEATPFRGIQTLAGICQNVNNQGDSKDVFGQSNFVQALTLMTTDVNSEILKLVTQKQKFGVIEYLPFVPIFTMSTIQNFFVGIMPGTALIYGGPVGYIFRVVIVLVSMICYFIISRINTSIPVSDDDRGKLMQSLLEKNVIKKFVLTITPKNKKALRLKMKLKNALSLQTVEIFYLKKVIYGAITYILALLCVVSTITLGKEYIRNSTQQLSLVATNEMDSYKHEDILKLDDTYLSDPDKYVEEEKLKGLIKSYMPGLSDLQVIDQVKRLQDKKESLDNAYFKWYYVWVCFLVACIGWRAPDVLLWVRKTLVTTESEDDFLQLQTLISIFMNTDMDTLEVLYQLSEHTRIHKDMLVYCYHSFPSNPELELTRLQSKTPLPEFKRLIGKLQLTINDLSLQEAFSDLLVEREYVLKLREKSIEATIEKKRLLCSPVSLTPLGLMVITMLLFPICYLGLKEMMNAMAMI